MGAMAKPKASDINIVMDDTTAIPTVYSNHQGVGRTAMEFTITFNMIRIPLNGIPADNTLHARPLIEVIMPPPAALGLLQTMAAQLGMRVEEIGKDTESAQPKPRARKA
jgi:hypothetical protein